MTTTVINAYDAAHGTLNEIVAKLLPLGWYVDAPRSCPSKQYLSLKASTDGHVFEGGPLGICLEVIGHSRDPKIKVFATWGAKDWLGRMSDLGASIVTTMTPSRGAPVLAADIMSKVVQPYYKRWAEMVAANKAKHEAHKKAIDFVYTVGAKFKLSRAAIESRIKSAHDNKVEFFLLKARISVSLLEPTFQFDYVHPLDESHLNIVEAFVETGDGPR